MSEVLLVEGGTDVDFFRALLEANGLGGVDVTPPRSYGQPNSATVLPEVLRVIRPQLENGQITKLAIISDADHDSGAGVAARWKVLTALLREFGYHAPEQLPGLANTGSVFTHPDGLPKVGLWLLPNHHDNGMLEDLILTTAVPDEPQPALVGYARSVIKKLPVTLFSRHQEAKALAYSWLAWQRRPGLGLEVLVRASLLDPGREPLKGLIGWLKKVFI